MPAAVIAPTLPPLERLDPLQLQLTYLETGSGDERRFYLLLGVPGQAPTVGAGGVVRGAGEQSSYRGCKVWIRDGLEASGKAWAAAARGDETLGRYRPLGGRAVSPKSGHASVSGSIPVAFDPTGQVGRLNLALIWRKALAVVARSGEARLADNGIPDLFAVPPIAAPVAAPEEDETDTTEWAEAGSVAASRKGRNHFARGKGAAAQVGELVIGMLEEGIVPWRKGWVGLGLPRNIRGNHYGGFNQFLLSCAGRRQPDGGYVPFGSPWWLTRHQVEERGGTITEGEEPWPVFYMADFIKKEPDPDAEDGERRKKIKVLRLYSLYNLEQVEGVTAPPSVQVDGAGTDAAAEAIVAAMPSPPRITDQGGDRAFYRPSVDTVYLPKASQFHSTADRYSTLFHELGHSTGHASRLDRPGIRTFDHFGSDRYGREELVAEMCSAILMAEVGLATSETMRNDAAYLANWIRTIKADPKVLVSGGSQAQRAADHILGVKVAKRPAELTEATEPVAA